MLVLLLKWLFSRWVRPYCEECGAALLAAWCAPALLSRRVDAPVRCCTECFSFLASRRGIRIEWEVTEVPAEIIRPALSGLPGLSLEDMRRGAANLSRVLALNAHAAIVAARPVTEGVRAPAGADRAFTTDLVCRVCGGALIEFRGRAMRSWIHAEPQLDGSDQHPAQPVRP